MTSLAREIRQNTPAYYMPISSLNGIIYQYNPTAGSVTFSTATWADGWVSTTGGHRCSGPSRYISTLNQTGAGDFKRYWKTSSFGRSCVPQSSAGCSPKWLDFNLRRGRYCFCSSQTKCRLSNRLY